MSLCTAALGAASTAAVLQEHTPGDREAARDRAQQVHEGVGGAFACELHQYSHAHVHLQLTERPLQGYLHPAGSQAWHTWL